MSIKTQGKDIDGIAFEVTQLPAMRAMLLFHRLGKVVSPALAKLGGGVSLSDVGGLDLAKLGGALEGFFMSCTESDLKHFVDELLYAATADGAPLKQVLDVKLQGKVFTLLKLLVFALEVNYNDFYKGLASAQALVVTQKKASASTLKADSPKKSESSGPSGA